MTVSEFCCISIGMLFNVLTFVLGVTVGVSLVKRKDSRHDDRNSYEAEGLQYYSEPSEN